MTDEEVYRRLLEILREARKGQTPEVLVNYFPADSLKYLVDPTADIACSSVVYQDDPNEIVAGARRYIDWLVGSKNLPVLHGEDISARINDFVHNGRERLSYVPYIFCLTTQTDNSCFWCRYAKGGGYAVGFDTSKIIKYTKEVCVRTTSTGEPGQLLYLMPVLYTLSDKQYIESYFELMYQQKRDAFDRYAKGDPSAECPDVVAQIIVVSAIVKDEKYAAEKEWRILLYPKREDLGDAKESFQRAVKEKQESPKPRLKSGIYKLTSPDLRDTIRCIWVSAQGEKQMLHSRVRKQLGMLQPPMSGSEAVADGGVFVRDSEVGVPSCDSCPFRSTCPDARPRWNRGNSTAKVAPKKKPSAIRGIVAGLAAVAVAVAGIVVFMSKGGAPVEKAEKNHGRIVDLGKGQTGANGPSRSTDQAATAGANAGTNALTRLKPPKIHPEYPRTNADGSVTKIMKDGTTYRVMPRSKNWKKQHPFKHKLEMQLSWYVAPGEAAPPMLPVTYTEKEIMDALIDKVEITDDDDDDMIMRKEAVQEMKGELRKWIKNGGDVESYIKDLAHRQQMEFETLQETRKMVMDAVKSGDIGLARDLEAKFNEHLKSKGLPTLKFPKVYRDQLNNGGEQ